MRRSPGFAILLAALALLCASATALADGGLLPDEPISTGTPARPDLAMAPNGYAAAAWEQTLAGGQFTVAVATRPPGGAWSRAELLGANANNKLQVGVAVDAAGAVAVAWQEIVTPNAFSWVASRAAGGAFTAPEQLPDAASVSSPGVGIDASGRVTLIYNPYPRIVVRDFQAGTAALAAAPQTVSSGSPSTCFGGGLLAVAASGDAVAGYQCGGAVFALRRAGTWNVSPPVPDDTSACPGVSTSNTASNVAIDAQGHAAGVVTTRVVNTSGAIDPTFCFLFRQETDTIRLVLPVAGFMQPLVGASITVVGAFGTLQSPIAGTLLGISPSGPVLSWMALDGTGYRLRLRDFSPDGTQQGADQTIDPDASVLGPQLAVGGDGRALLAWFRSPGRSNVPLPLQVTSRPPGGAFGPPQEITPDGSQSGALGVALDDAGSGAIAFANDTPPVFLHVRGFDAAAPQLSGVAIPATATAGTSTGFAASPFDVWGPVTLSWSFGDGAGGTGAAPQHAYARAGSYTVTVTAADAAGNAASRSGVMQVLAAGGPALSRVSLTHRAFRVGDRPTAVSAARRTRRRARGPPVGTTFRFTLDRAASVTIAFARPARGLRGGRGGRCVRPSRRLARARRCTRFVAAGRLVRAGRAGVNAVAFSGRVGRRALRPARYRATLTGRAGGRAGAPRAISFRVVRP